MFWVSSQNKRILLIENAWYSGVLVFDILWSECFHFAISNNYYRVTHNYDDAWRTFNSSFNTFFLCCIRNVIVETVIKLIWRLYSHDEGIKLKNLFGFTSVSIFNFFFGVFYLLKRNVYELLVSKCAIFKMNCGRSNISVHRLEVERIRIIFVWEIFYHLLFWSSPHIPILET